MGILIDQVYAGYHKRNQQDNVLKNLSFTIEEGTTVCILGENGCGKSTLLRVIAGILDYRGSVQLEGCEVRKMKRRELSSWMAFLSQFSSVYFSYTVWETVMLGRYLQQNQLFGKPSHKDCERVEECLAMTGLLGQKDVLLGNLSGGQLQRVFLARTFAQDTPYILLDEPTNHLDLKYQKQLLTYLQKWIGQTKTDAKGNRRKNTLIGVFHDINLALQLGDQFVLMKEGRILFHGNRHDMMQTNVLNRVFDLDVSHYMREQLEYW